MAAKGAGAGIGAGGVIVAFLAAALAMSAAHDRAAGGAEAPAAPSPTPTHAVASSGASVAHGGFPWSWTVCSVLFVVVLALIAWQVFRAQVRKINEFDAKVLPGIEAPSVRRVAPEEVDDDAPAVRRWSVIKFAAANPQEKLTMIGHEYVTRPATLSADDVRNEARQLMRQRAPEGVRVDARVVEYIGQ